MDGVSFKPVLFGERKAVRQSVFGEMGHSRGIKTKRWKYIAVRYPAEVQRRIEQGKKFPAFQAGRRSIAPTSRATDTSVTMPRR
jgi:arylsulfatase A-like enzyme